MNYHLHLGRSGECETASVSNWSDSQSWGRNPRSWSRRHFSTRSGRLQQHGSQKPHQPLPVSSQVLQRYHSPENVGHVFLLRSVSGQILRQRSGADMASMLPIKSKKLESWSRNILRYIEKSCTSLGFKSCLVCHVESINVMACCSHWLNSKE